MAKHIVTVKQLPQEGYESYTSLGVNGLAQTHAVSLEYSDGTNYECWDSNMPKAVCIQPVTSKGYPQRAYVEMNPKAFAQMAIVFLREHYGIDVEALCQDSAELYDNIIDDVAEEIASTAYKIYSDEDLDALAEKQAKAKATVELVKELMK